MTKKLSNTKVNTIDKNNNLSKKDTKLFNEFVKTINIKHSKPQNDDEAYNRLGSIISEFLKNFILIGYGLHGERVVMRHDTCAKDADAVNELLRMTFMKFVNSED